MIQAWSMVGGAIDPREAVGPGRRLVDVDGVLVAHGVDPVPDHGLVDLVAGLHGRPAGLPSKAAQRGQQGVGVGRRGAVDPDVDRAHRAARVMPRPAMATISRWISFTPPPKVLIWAWRAVRSSRPASTAPGSPGRGTPPAPTIPSRRR